MNSLDSLKKTINDLFNWSANPQQPKNTQTKSQKASPAGQIPENQKATKSQKHSSNAKNDDHNNETNQRKPQQSGNNVMNYLRNILIEEEVSCPICLTKYKKPGLIQMCTCKHLYCGPCLRQYINTKIADYSLPNCPQETCNSTINKQTSFFKALTQKTKNLINKIEKFHYTSNDPYLKMCPEQNCDGIIPLIEGQPFKCSLCHNQFCKKCMYIKHDGKCAKNQVTFLNMKYNYRKCNKCQIIVEKTQACNHMTCKCGYEFCYGCGKKWSGSHHCPPKRQINVVNRASANIDRSSESFFKKFLRLCSQILLTILLFCGISVYAGVCLLPMMFVTLLFGLLLGILVYSFKFVYDTFKNVSVEVGILLIIFFPMAMVFGIIEAFKTFWCEGFLFWWEVLRQAIQKPLGLIWS